ncbi:hypothetical protein SALBM217S_07942 [Streptomyces griseoloalbus]
MNRLWPAVARVTDSALGPYQTAVLRIGVALTWLLFLLREYPHRQELYGPDSPWSWDLAAQLVGANDAFTVLLWSDSQVWFEAVYALAVLFSLLLLLGRRTRTMTALFMVGVLSLQNRSVFMGDGGDNVLHLMAIYLLFTRCGHVWSLDARRARRAARGMRAGGADTRRSGPRAVGGARCRAAPRLFGGPDGRRRVDTRAAVGGVARAGGVVAGRTSGADGPAADPAGRGGERRAQRCAAGDHGGGVPDLRHGGLVQVEGSRWQDGTAVHYPLHLEYFWLLLAGLLTASGTLVMLVTHVTVVQVAFPFTLFNRRVKNVLLGFMILEHAVIAVVLGLPFFSLAMIAADAVFLPTSFLCRAGRLAARARGRLRPRGDAVPVPPPRRPDGPPGRPSAVGPARPPRRPTGCPARARRLLGMTDPAHDPSAASPAVPVAACRRASPRTRCCSTVSTPSSTPCASAPRCSTRHRGPGRRPGARRRAGLGVRDTLAALLTQVPYGTYAALVPRPHPTAVAALAVRPGRAGNLAKLARAPRTAPVVVLDQPRNLGNAGAVVRLAARFGATGVVTTGTLDPWHPTVVRGGAGLHFATAVERLTVDELPPGPVFALDPEGEDILAEAPRRGAALAFGSERTGPVQLHDHRRARTTGAREVRVTVISREASATPRRGARRRPPRRAP